MKLEGSSLPYMLVGELFCSPTFLIQAMKFIRIISFRKSQV